MEERKPNILSEIISKVEAEEIQTRLRVEAQKRDLQNQAERFHIEKAASQLERFTTKLKPILEGKTQELLKDPTLKNLDEVSNAATELINGSEGINTTNTVIVNFYRKGLFYNLEATPDFTFDVKTGRWAYNPELASLPVNLQTRIDFEYDEHYEHTGYSNGHYTEGHDNHYKISYYPNRLIKIGEKTFEATKNGVENVSKFMANIIRAKSYHYAWYDDWNDGPDTGGGR